MSSVDAVHKALGRLEAARRGLGVPFASSRGTTFSADRGVAAGFLLSVFLHDGEFYRTYSTAQRGIDRLIFNNCMRDLLPYGRQEDWED